MKQENIIVIKIKEDDPIKLNNIYHVVGVKKNLFSVINVMDSGSYWLFFSRGVKILRNIIKELKANIVHTGWRI